MKNKWLLLPAALAAGFAVALLAAGVHSTFFILLPILAFIFGYFSNRRSGLVCGILMGFSYTFTLSLMWEVHWALIGLTQYFAAFIFGGFSLLLLGGIAWRVREGVKKPGAIIALVILAIVVIGSAYVSVPRYRYSYGLNIMCAENTEIFVPVVIASNEFSATLINNIVTPTGNSLSGLDEVEIVKTEYGQMWRLKMISHWSAGEGQIGVSSSFGQVSDEVHSWPGFITDDYLVEQFKTPIKVRSVNPVKYQIILNCSIERTSGLNFGYQKSEGYILRNNWYDGITGDDWVMVPVEAVDAYSFRGFGD